jgi:hypothetical protein
MTYLPKKSTKRSKKIKEALERAWNKLPCSNPLHHAKWAMDGGYDQAFCKNPSYPPGGFG